MNQSQNILLYSLEVIVSNRSTGKLDIHDHVLAGLDPRNDLILVDPKISARHFLFKAKDDLLTLHFLGDDSTTFLNNHPLEKDKTYILEKGDRLKCGKVELRIRQEMAPIRPHQEPRPVPVLIDQPLPEKTGKTHIEAVEVEKPEVVKKSVPKKKTKSNANIIAMKKIPFKVYGFVFDLCLTYFVLAFAIPVSGLLDLIQSLLYPMTEFFNKTFLLNYPEYAQMKILSTIEFMIVFHILMIFSSLALGNTPGAFLVGLVPEKKTFLGNRFRSYLYSLLNSILLPFALFDFPIYHGKTLKELITFHQRIISPSPTYKFLRVTIVPAMIVLMSLTPLFLKYPYSAVVTEEKIIEPKFKDLHTQFINSSSKKLGTALKTELNADYSILPYLEKNKIGMTLYHHPTQTVMIMNEMWRMKTEKALFKLRYSNPFSSLYLPNEEMNSELLKNRAVAGLMTSPLHFLGGIRQFGYFYANAVVFKREFLKDFLTSDTFLLLPFDEKNPFMVLSSKAEEYVFWFTNKEIIAFKLSAPKQTKLLEQFKRDILAGMRFNQGTDDKLKTPQILETLEAFDGQNYPVLLTYYIYEAKKAADKHQSKKDPAWRAFLKKNILQAKLSIDGDQNKNIERSFDDIMNTL